MDLLARPPKPHRSLDNTPLLAPHRWDGGEFKTYADRTGRLQWVPHNLRLGQKADEIPHIHPERRPPEHRDEENSFFQSWFFFGLLAEILCVNQIEEERPFKLARLYKDFAFTEAGKHYVTGRKLLEVDLPSLWAKDPRGLKARIQYLRQCIAFTEAMVTTSRGRYRLQFDIHNSICALGEHISAILSKISSNNDGIILPLDWGRDYIHPSGEVESAMLQNGWCKSDISRVRGIYYGLNTQYYLSQIVPQSSGLDHAHCRPEACIAAQIIPGKYTLSHATQDCDCSTISIDVAEVDRILKTTNSFPILTVHQSCKNLDTLAITIEEYVPANIMFKSQVWAHGLGNPYANSLLRCQIARVGSLVNSLSKTHNMADSSLRIWLDTLCCPIEVSGKSIALERMSSVYRQARHVLVLDRSILQCESRLTHPALLALTILACSTWMRRLWTLQEALLPTSLYFQFADQPLTLEDILEDFSKQAALDIRYEVIYRNVQDDARNLGVRERESKFGKESLSGTITNRLWELQGALEFRSVSVADDEPLCIETLLALEPPQVVKINGKHQRMAHIWKMLAQANAIPPKIIFYVDKSIPLRGFGWAPQSLLTSDSDSHLAEIPLNDRLNPFQPVSGGDNTDNHWHQPATLTDTGLLATYPGQLIGIHPWRENGSLDGWKPLVPKYENTLVCYDETRKTWYYFFDIFVSRVVDKWPAHRREAYRQENPWPMLKAIKGGNIALIRDPTSDLGVNACGLLVRLRQGDSAINGDVLEVEKLCSVLLCRLDVTYCTFLDVLSQLCTEAATKLASLYGDGLNANTSAPNVIKVLQGVITERLVMDNAFEQAFLSIMGHVDRKNAWFAFGMWRPFNLISKELPKNQTWIVDKRDF